MTAALIAFGELFKSDRPYEHIGSFAPKEQDSSHPWLGDPRELRLR